jgi:hypothetical protein
MRRRVGSGLTISFNARVYLCSNARACSALHDPNSRSCPA